MRIRQMRETGVSQTEIASAFGISVDAVVLVKKLKLVDFEPRQQGRPASRLAATDILSRGPQRSIGFEPSCSSERAG